MGLADDLECLGQVVGVAGLVLDLIARVGVFEHSSHFPWLEEPDRFTTTVRGWLRERGIVP